MKNILRGISNWTPIGGKMLTGDEIEEHLVVLRIAYDHKSPFRGMVDFKSEGGLLSLPIPEQRQIHDAMGSELKALVFGEKPA